MAILGFNRILAWTVVAAALWAFLAVSAALGMLRGDGPPPVKLSLGMEKGGFGFPGRIVGINETTEMLSITLAQPPGRETNAMPAIELPEGVKDIQISIDSSGNFKPGPPRISLVSGQNKPLELPGGRLAVVTSKYIVLFGRDFNRIVPKPERLDREWLRRLAAPEMPGQEPGSQDRARPGDRIRERLQERPPLDEPPPGDPAAPPPTGH